MPIQEQPHLFKAIHLMQDVSARPVQRTSPFIKRVRFIIEHAVPHLRRAILLD